MTTKVFNSLTLDVTLSVPSTVDEFDKLAKKPGTCLSEAVNNVVYRSILNELRDTFLHGRAAIPAVAATATTPAQPGLAGIRGLDDITGISRKETAAVDKDGKPRKDSKGVPIMVYDENEAVFFKRVCAQKGWTTPELVKQNCQALMDTVAAAMVFDPAASERQPAGPKKLPQIYRDSAANILSKADLATVQAKLGAKLKAESGTVFTLLPEPKLHAKSDDKAKAEHVEVRAKNVELLGWAIKANEDAKRPTVLAAYSV